MKNAVLLIVFLIITVTPAVGQTEWEQELGEDLVEVKDGKMIIEDFFLYTLGVEGFEAITLQVKIYAEAPEKGVVSRDNFVSIATLVSYQTLLGAFAESYQMRASDFMEAIEIEDLTSPIGTPDLELNLVATDQGMQVEIVNTATNEKNRVTMTWAEMYAE